MLSGSRSDSEGGEHFTLAQLHMQSPGLCKYILLLYLHGCVESQSTSCTRRERPWAFWEPSTRAPEAAGLPSPGAGARQWQERCEDRRRLLPPSCPGLHCFPPLPNASHRFCTEGRRLPAARAPKPQEASNKRLFKLDADGKAQVLYLFPNHCCLLSCADPAAQPHPWQVLVPKSLLLSPCTATQSPGARSHAGALAPAGLRTAARRAPQWEGDGAKALASPSCPAPACRSTGSAHQLQREGRDPMW